VVTGDQSPLERLIDAHGLALAAFAEIGDFHERIAKDDPKYPEMEAEYNRRHAAEDAALMAVFSYPAKTLEEARIKAEFLLQQAD
jgi:hypothetical protein